MSVTLDAYQVEAARRMSAASRFLLSDAPGVGKTYPAIAAAQTVPGRKLVVCPAHLCYQWTLALEAMSEKAVALEGPAEKKRKILAAGHQWTVCSYHMLGRSRAYTGLLGPWAVAIFDEAHMLRGRKSTWTKAAMMLKADRVYLLTGTPEIGNAGDFYTLAAMLGRLSHRSFWRFVGEHCCSELGHFGRKIGGLKDPRRFHATVLDDSCYLRRTLVDVGIGSGEPVSHVTHHKLDRSDKRIHDTAAKEYRDHNDRPMFDAGTVAHYMRHHCSWPQKTNYKLLATKHALNGHPKEKAVVLCWYRDIRDRLADKLSADRHVFTVRAENAKEFQRQEIHYWAHSDAGVLVGTLPHMKEGIDGLQCASVLVLYECSWLHAENEQAVARLARRGQDNTVHVYQPVVDGTIDGSVWRAAQERRTRTLKDLLEDVR